MKKNTIFFIFTILVPILILGKIKDPDFRETRELVEIFPKWGKLQQMDGEWSKPVNISNSSNISWDPIVGADSDGKAYAVWVEGEGAGKKIYFNTNKNGSWGTSRNITGGIPLLEGPWPDLFVENNGTVHLVFTGKYNRNYETFYNRYKDGTWSGPIDISETWYGGSAYPSISGDNSNHFRYVVWQDNENIEWEIMFRYKNPNVTYWSNVDVISTNSKRVYTPEITVDGNGKVHVVWQDRKYPNNSVVYYTHNPDPAHNNKWTYPIAISDKTLLGWCEPQIVSDNTGNVYVVWEDKNTGNNEILFRKKINGNWEPIENISNTYTNSLSPTIAVDRNSGNIYVAWEEKAGDWKIFFKFHQNGRWSQTENVTNNSSASINPSLWVDDAGEIHLVYADNFRGPYEIMYTSTKEIAPQVYPPINVFLETKLDNSQTEKINILSWEKNPENKNLEIINYKIYRKEIEQKDDEYILIKSVTGETFEYEDKNLPTTRKYSYSLTAVAQGGYESEASEWVTEEKVFPPINITLNTEINSSLFSDEKINIIRWNKNPLNDAITVINYKIYRKKSDQEDIDYKLISTKNADTFEFMDRNLHLEKKYTYMMTVIDRDGNVSKKSGSVSEN